LLGFDDLLADFAVAVPPQGVHSDLKGARRLVSLLH
jgi:hypothetical protein